MLWSDAVPCQQYLASGSKDHFWGANYTKSLQVITAIIRPLPREMDKETVGVFSVQTGQCSPCCCSLGQSGDAAAGTSWCCCSGIQHLSCSGKGSKTILLS